MRQIMGNMGIFPPNMGNMGHYDAEYKQELKISYCIQELKS